MYCIIIDNNIIVITPIIVMKRACLTCFDCCSEIGDKVSFLFLNVLARTFVWFDLSDTGLERVSRRFPGVSDRRECSDTSADVSWGGAGGGTRWDVRGESSSFVLIRNFLLAFPPS